MASAEPAGGTVEESPAIEALGPLFTLKEVYIEDGAVIDFSVSSKTRRRSMKAELNPTANDYTSLEDMELAREMEALGLPITFSSTKETNVLVPGVRMGLRVKTPISYTDNPVQVTEPVMENVLSSNVLSDGRNTPNVCNPVHPRADEIPATVLVPDVLGSKEHTFESQVVDPSCSANTESVADESENPTFLVDFDPKNSYGHETQDAKFRTYYEGNLSSNLDTSFGLLPAMVSKLDAQSDDTQSSETCSISTALDENSQCYDYGLWKVAWDDLYRRYYFYNCKTEESTWEPPAGLEHFTYPTCSMLSSTDLAANATEDEADRFECRTAGDEDGDCIRGENGHLEDLNASQEASDVPRKSLAVSLVPSFCSYTGGDTDEQDAYWENISFIKPKKRRSSSKTSEGGKFAVSRKISKYYYQRYLLFSKYDSGVKIDSEGWFSVTPESIARHHAVRCGGGIVIDCFCGVGGNTIQFAQKSNYVFAIDIDPQKVKLAHHNAAIYGVDYMIDFLVGDFLTVAPKLRGDTVFLSPPWGGPDYSKQQTYDMRTMLKPCDGESLFKVAAAIAPKIVMYLPRNLDMNQLAELSLAVNPPWTLEVEKNYLNGKLKAITAYFSNHSVGAKFCDGL